MNGEVRSAHKGFEQSTDRVSLSAIRRAAAAERAPQHIPMKVEDVAKALAARDAKIAALESEIRRLEAKG